MCSNIFSSYWITGNIFNSDSVQDSVSDLVQDSISDSVHGSISDSVQDLISDSVQDSISDQFQPFRITFRNSISMDKF